MYPNEAYVLAELADLLEELRQRYNHWSDCADSPWPGAGGHIHAVEQVIGHFKRKGQGDAKMERPGQGS